MALALAPPRPSQWRPQRQGCGEDKGLFSPRPDASRLEGHPLSQEPEGFLSLTWALLPSNCGFLSNNYDNTDSCCG